MPWPKGRLRKVKPKSKPKSPTDLHPPAVSEPPAPIAAEPEPELEPPIIEPTPAPIVAVAPEPKPPRVEPFDLLATRRIICAHHVRQHQVPRELRPHDHLSLGRWSKLIRREMKENGAADSEVEDYVARYVDRV